MVTVIATKEELTTPVNGGVTGIDSSDNERPFQFIRDYQEVDFHRSPSCKPLPNDLFGTVNDQISKSSIKGTFFVQIDSIERFIPMNNNQNEQNNLNNRLLLTLTDGIVFVKALTNDHIPNLNIKSKSGSKLLLTNMILINDGLLQLTNDNTKFHYGSNTYARPRAMHRNRGNGSNRMSYEGRRNHRHDNDDNETNFLIKRTPPKTTLMDFMTSLKISNDEEKFQERSDNHKRRNYNEQINSTNTTNNDNINYQSHSSLNNNNNNYNEQIIGIDEQFDFEDDNSHGNYRERRNHLPPRLQRAHEQRSRRNPHRYSDDSMIDNDLNSIYRNDASNNPSLSSLSSLYLQHGDQTSAGHQHPTSLNTYVPPGNLLTATVNGSTPTHLTFYPNSSGYPFQSIPSPPYGNQPTLIGHTYPNEHFQCYFGTSYGHSTYLPPPTGNGFNNDLKTNGNSNSENENSEIQNDENNDSGIKLESSTTEQKQTSSSNIQEEKRRDSNSNTRHRWKIGEMCFARWSEDGQFYYATIVDIQPPYCTVMFCDYNCYSQVTFHDLKMVSREQQFFPGMISSTDLTISSGDPYFQPRSTYYQTTIDGCLIMPEAPPFPFNSSGTLYMYPSAITTLSRPTRFNSNVQQQSIRRNENGELILNSSSSPSKDSNETSAIDTTTTSSNDENLQQDPSLPKPDSIADTPSALIEKDEKQSTNQD